MHDRSVALSASSKSQMPHLLMLTLMRRPMSIAALYIWAHLAAEEQEQYRMHQR